MPRKKKAEPPKHPAVDYLERIGGGLTFVSLVSLYTYPQFYWWGVGAFYAGFASLATGVLLESWPVRYRIAVCVLWVSIAALISLNIIFVSAPLEIVPLAQ